jgi:uncharacterized protein YndB with AHSA1/START domain
VDFEAATVLAAPADRVFAEVADLATYPHWLGIVQAAAPTTDEAAWMVELGARLGPFRRTKRVRMVRRVCDRPVAVRFERREDDGREHSPWVLRADLAPTTDGTELTVRLHYGGAAWVPGLDMVLGQEVRRAGTRLAARLA